MLISRAVGLWLAVMAATLLAGCRGEREPTAARGPLTPDDPMRIVVSIAPLAQMVNELLPPEDRGLVSVSILLPVGATPHGFEPGPADAAAVERADLVLAVGMGLDNWALRGVRQPERLLQMSDFLPSDAADHDHAHHHDHDHGHAHDEHDHGPFDAHLWFEPELVRATMHGVVDRMIALCGSDPEGRAVADRLRAAQFAFDARINNTMTELQAMLSPYRGRKVITFHDAFRRVLDRHEIDLAAALRSIESVEPAPADIRRAVESIRDHGIGAVFIEPQFNALAAEQIAAQTGVALVEIDPLGHGEQTWSELMLAIGAAFVRGLSHDAVLPE